MLRTLLLTAALASTIDAYPYLQTEFIKRAGEHVARNPQPVTQQKRACSSSSGTGTVPDPALLACTFDAAAQYVSTSGQHAYVAPTSTDQRGPCPGLNAAANHGYIPHNGIATIDQFVTGTYNAFGMGVDLAGFLAVYGAVFDGDLTKWSIGGPDSRVGVPGLFTPQGISGSHNNYETDVSPTRGDLYETGNDYLGRVDQFKQLYAYQASQSNANSNYNLEILQDFRSVRWDHSLNNNPYFYSGFFTGVLVQPAAFTFIYRFMANKSAEYPDGRLTQEILKDFFAMTGPDANGNFTYAPGTEKIPDNWYKRPIGDEYTIPFFLADVVQEAAVYPKFLSVGGNLGKTNDFVGIAPENITGGVYNGATLLQGNNLGCFAFETLIQAAPDFLQTRFTAVGNALNALNPKLGSIINTLGCPKLNKIDMSQFKQLPGYTKSNGGMKM